MKNKTILYSIILSITIIITMSIAGTFGCGGDSTYVPSTATPVVTPTPSSVSVNVNSTYATAEMSNGVGVSITGTENMEGTLTISHIGNTEFGEMDENLTGLDKGGKVEINLTEFPENLLINASATVTRVAEANVMAYYINEGGEKNYIVATKTQIGIYIDRLNAQVRSSNYSGNALTLYFLFTKENSNN